PLRLNSVLTPTCLRSARRDWHLRLLTAVPACRHPSLHLRIGLTWTTNSCGWWSIASNGSSGRSTWLIHYSRPRPWTLTGYSLRFSPQIISTIRRELLRYAGGAALESCSLSTPTSWSGNRTLLTLRHRCRPHPARRHHRLGCPRR